MRRLFLTLSAFFAIAVPANAAWTWPVSGEVITPYRNGTDPYASGQHRGIDIGAPVGMPVIAAAGGEVLFAGTAGSSGLTISVRTGDGHDTSYLHLSSVAVRKGARVAAGERIGAVGTTGTRSAAAPHLHFGVRDAGTRHDYHDPLAFLPPPPRAPEPPPPAPAPQPAPPASAPAPVRRPAPRRLPRAAPRWVPRAAPGELPRAVPRPRPRALPGHGPAGRAVPEPLPAPLSFGAPKEAPHGLRSPRRTPLAHAGQPDIRSAHADAPFRQPARAGAPAARPAVVASGGRRAERKTQRWTATWPARGHSRLGERGPRG